MPPKYRDIQKRLEEDGWRLKAQRGSHTQWVHPVKKGKITLVAKHPILLRMGHIKAFSDRQV